MELPQVCVAYLMRERADGIREVLLGRKKKGLGRGYFVGLGGKLEPGESPLEAAVREIEEESGLVVRPEWLEARGRLSYHFPHRPAWSQQSSVFVTGRWQGIPVGSAELDPEWFGVDALPLGEMWDDAKYWLPGVLAGGSASAHFTFGPDLASVVEWT